MYLIDTNIISESRKGLKANIGVQRFFDTLKANNQQAFNSALTIGELRKGIEAIRYRNDTLQANKLEAWLNMVLSQYNEKILNFTSIEAEVWGKLLVPHNQNSIDKQIAATALVYNLTLVTRNTKDFQKLGLRILNPFQ